MVALIEFLTVGLIFFLLLKLPKNEKEAGLQRRITFKQAFRKIVSEFWIYYVIPTVLVILALNIAYNIDYWRAEMKGILLSSLMLFCAFFIYTATYIRMKDDILGPNLLDSKLHGQ